MQTTRNRNQEETAMNTVPNHFDALKLHSFSGNLELMLNRYPQAREIILEVFESLCIAEIAERQVKTIAYRIEQARFGQIQTIDAFDFAYNDSLGKMKNRYLRLFTPELLNQGISILMVGSAGLGKTHLARALGYFFCQQSVRVLFTTLSRMSLDLFTADTTGTLKKTMLAYTNPTLLIIDEVGYVSLREVESNLVFQIISARYEQRRSTMITTNRPFGEWNQIFHNDAMAHALLDRLIQRSEVFHLEGASYRETHRTQLKN
jgi:DNA replication protein DnaC